MSLQSGIFGRDIARMVTERPHETMLLGRPIVDPKQKEDAEFFLEHGMTRAQAADRERVLARDEFENAAVADLQFGEPPAEICNTRGLSPKRARYARYFEWRIQETEKLSELESRKSHFESLIEAPKATEAEIHAEVRRTAAALMGRDVDGAGSLNRKALEDRFASERHSAEAAQHAMPRLERAIEISRLRLSTLNSREMEFLNPAIIEVANELGLGELYVKKVAELRTVLELINGLSNVAGEWGTFSGLEARLKPTDRFEAAAAVNLPRPGLAALSTSPKDSLAITRSGNNDVWERLRQSLLLDPRHNAKNFIPLPK